MIGEKEENAASMKIGKIDNVESATGRETEIVTVIEIAIVTVNTRVATTRETTQIEGIPLTPKMKVGL